MRRTRDPVALLRELESAPWRHDFFQTLRMLECAYPQRPRLGQSLRPQDDAIRLSQDPSLNFAPAVFSSLQAGANGAPPRLVQQFFGLFGPNGPLPLHLTEFARERLLHHRDAGMVRFLDLLHHRPLSLFYRAWAQAQPTVSFDRPATDRFSTYVGALVGMGTPALRRRDEAGDHVRLFFAGWLSRQTRSAEGLRSLLGGFFRLPVRITEFAGHWMRLPADDVTRIGTRTAGCVLGQGAVLGGRVWDRQHRIQVAFGPLTFEQYEAFLPGGVWIKRLVALMRHYLGFELDWDVRLTLAAKAVPCARLGGGTRLGWTSWLGGRDGKRDADELVLDAEKEHSDGTCRRK
ncbi:MAG: type VI secretion system baseplate subunit TssG [Panacagrimonas sp.]